ncbi:MAG: hypothetical protein QM487_07640 [Candidatus Marithrix sp.]
MKNVKIYKCFIASPSDTQEERDICDKVFQEINKTQGELLGFRIESKKWENDARPSFGKNSQDVINKQLLGDFQLFIGIMFKKFGTPTEKFNSGTEEEFYLAYDKYEEKADVEIMFYFNDEPTNPHSIDLKQFYRVKEFRELISDCGGLYWPYQGINNFEDELRRHLNQYFIDKEGTSQGKNDADGHILKNIEKLLKDRLNESLSTFSNQPEV